MNLNNMTFSVTEIAILMALCVVIVAGIAAVVIRRKQRTARLRSQFGTVEYDRALEKDGDRRHGEAGLERRTKHVEGLHLRPLTSADRERYLESWRGVQTRFVDGPAGAVADADQLVGDVMLTRGYPVSNFEQRAADLSVAHPVVLDNYRLAHEIAVRQSLGQASTEDLRRAMVHYRTLFDDLVSEPKLSVARAGA